MDREHFLQRIAHLREQGQSIRAIAAALGVNRGRVERSVKILAFVTHIFNKIIVANRAEATAYAIRHGLA
jgi:DNA-binding NarL/FixJ family response regulator